MTISRLTTSRAGSFGSVIAELESRGYSRAALTKSLSRYLAEVSTGLGTAASELTSGQAVLLAGIVNKLAGGSVSAATTPFDELLADVVNAGDIDDEGGTAPNTLQLGGDNLQLGGDDLTLGA